MSSARNFYGSSSSTVSTPVTGSRQSKRRRIDLAKAIRVSNNSDVSDSDLDVSDSDFGIATDEASSEKDPLNNSLNSTHNSLMYSFTSSTPIRPPSTTSGSVPSNDAGSSDHISDLLQRQNDLIKEMLKKQEGLSGALEEVKADLKETRSHVDQLLEEQKTKVQATSNKLKRKYPSSLTERLSKLHDRGEKQFDPEKSITDRNNSEVKLYLRSEISASYKEYTEEQVVLAVQRLYENQRRVFLNRKPENKQRAQEADVKKKYRARRERLYARRSKFVPQKLRKCWDKLNLHYMSEEDDGDDEKILVKKLPWRSDKLNSLIAKLDAAADTKAQSSSTFTPERKERVESHTPSSLMPPADAPNWALSVSYRKGQSNKENEVDTTDE